MAKTRQDIVLAFDEALKTYNDLDMDAKFDMIASELMRIGNRGYYVGKAERQGTTPTAVPDPEPDVAPVVDLTELSRSELRDLAKERGIAVGSKATKVELQEKLAAV
jgi:hypothetical protein